MAFFVLRFTKEIRRDMANLAEQVPLSYQSNSEVERLNQLVGSITVSTVLYLWGTPQKGVVGNDSKASANPPYLGSTMVCQRSRLNI